VISPEHEHNARAFFSDTLHKVVHEREPDLGVGTATTFANRESRIEEKDPLSSPIGEVGGRALDAIGAFQLFENVTQGRRHLATVGNAERETVCFTWVNIRILAQYDNAKVSSLKVRESGEPLVFWRKHLEGWEGFFISLEHPWDWRKFPTREYVIGH